MPRTFPDSSVAWSTGFPSIAVPSAIWTFQDTASPIDDKIGTADLSQNSAGPTYNQPGDPTGRGSLTFVTTDARFLSSADAAIGDIPNTQAWSMWVRFRMPDNGAAVRSICGKGAAAPFWVLRFQAGGILRWLLNPTTSLTLTTVGTFDDDAFHDVFLTYNPSEGANGTCHMYIGAEHISLAMAAGSWTTPGGVDAVAALQFGAASVNAPNAGEQISYAALWNGTALSAVQIAALLASDQTGSFEATAAATVAMDGILGQVGSMSVDAQAQVAIDGLSDTPAAMQVEATATVEIGEGILGASTSLAAGGSSDVTIGPGILGIVGTFSAEAVAMVEMEWELPPDEGQFLCSAFATVTMDSNLVTPEVIETYPLTGLRAVIAALSTNKVGDYQVRRRRTGQLDHGRYLRNFVQTFPIVAVVQPHGGAQLNIGREGRHTRERKLIITNTRLRAQNEVGDPDIVLIDGDEFEVDTVEKWDAFGNTHFEVIASKLSTP